MSEQLQPALARTLEYVTVMAQCGLQIKLADLRDRVYELPASVKLTDL